MRHRARVGLYPAQGRQGAPGRARRAAVRQLVPGLPPAGVLFGLAVSLAVDYLDPLGNPRTHVIADQYQIRNALHARFLYSSAFDVRIERDVAPRPATVTLAGAGWGHGAGLCQIGALGMALRGYDADRIVRHYFAGAEIRSCY